MDFVNRLMSSFSQDNFIALTVVLTVNLVAVYYGLDAWSPFRFVPNVLIVIYCLYRMRNSRP